MKKLLIVIILAKSLASFQPVDINSASAEQIAILPGIGKRLSEQIVRHRSVHGPILGLSSMTAVPGMTESKMALVKDKVIFLRAVNAKKIAELPKIAKPIFPVKPIIDIDDLEAKVLQVHGLSNELDRSLSHRVRKAAFLPKLSLVMNAGQDSMITDKGPEKLRDSRLFRGGNDVGVSIRLVFDLERLIFSKDELEVAKLSLRRLEKREKVIDKLHQYYFQYVRQLDLLKKPPDELSRVENIQAELARLEAFLDSMSDGEFTRYQQHAAIIPRATP
ncbi:MAG TPA: helix-hairpin-helix domain-containing protein [Myxococcota bacterium]|nr:helix-hairpin-helix domain-containing protein [Myxococcota bacterium]